MSVLVLESDPFAYELIQLALNRVGLQSSHSRQLSALSSPGLQEQCEGVITGTDFKDFDVFDVLRAVHRADQIPTLVLTEPGNDPDRLADEIRSLLLELDIEASIVPKTLLVNHLPKFCKTIGHDVDPKIARDLVNVPIPVIAQIGTLPTDLFLGLSATKTVKVLKAGDIFTEADADHYFERGIRSLSIHTKAFEGFYRESVRHLIKARKLRRPSKTKEDLQDLANESVFVDEKADLLSLSKAVSWESDQPIQAEIAYELSIAVVEQAKKMTRKLGLSAATLAVVEANVKLAVETLTQCDSIQEYIARLRVQPANYINAHSVMLAYASTAITSLLGWKTDSALYNLGLASFLHDMTLNDQGLARMRTMHDAKKIAEEVPIEELQAYESHPSEIAKIALDSEEIPRNVAQILSEHHERPDGTGFPQGLTASQISPLSACFIVAHDLVSFVFDKRQEDWSIPEFIEAQPSIELEGHFKVIYRELAIAGHKMKPTTTH